jgi:dienelactone hydrolase
MAEVLLFHHAHGLTAGVLAFADELRAAGHVVHTPDLYDGKTFAELADGVGYAEPSASGRSSSAAGSSPTACPMRSSTPGSRWE